MTLFIKIIPLSFFNFSMFFLFAQIKNTDQFVNYFLRSERSERSLANNLGLIKYSNVKVIYDRLIETFPASHFHCIQQLLSILYLYKKISLDQFDTDNNAGDFKISNNSFLTTVKP